MADDAARKSGSSKSSLSSDRSSVPEVPKTPIENKSERSSESISSSVSASEVKVPPKQEGASPARVTDTAGHPDRPSTSGSDRTSTSTSVRPSSGGPASPSISTPVRASSSGTIRSSTSGSVSSTISGSVSPSTSGHVRPSSGSIRPSSSAPLRGSLIPPESPSSSLVIRDSLNIPDRPSAAGSSRPLDSGSIQPSTNDTVRLSVLGSDNVPERFKNLQEEPLLVIPAHNPKFNRNIATVVGIILVILIIINAGIYYMYRATLMRVSKESYLLVCKGSKAECIKKRVISYRDDKVHPCENFYDHVCGNWPKKHPIKDGTIVNSFINHHVDVVKDDLIKVLNKLSTTTASNVRKVDRFVITSFQKCISPDPKSMSHLVNLLSKMKINETTAEYRDINAMIGLAIAHGISNIFSMEQFPNQENNRSTVPLIKFNRFWMSGDGVKEDFLTRATKNFYDTVTQQINEQGTMDLVKSVIYKTKQVVDMHVSSPSPPVQLSTSSEIAEPRRYATFNLTHLRRCRKGGQIIVCNEKQEEGIDLNSAMSPYLTAISPEMADKKFVVEDNVRWPHMVLENFTSEEVAALVKFSFAYDLGIFASNEILNARNRHEVMLGIHRRDRSRESMCLEKIAEWAPHALAFFMTRHLVKFKVGRIKNIFDNMKAAMNLIVSQANDTLAAQVQQKMIEKLSSMKVLIGHPGWTEDEMLKTLPDGYENFQSLSSAEIAIALSQAKINFTLGYKWAAEDTYPPMEKWSSSPLSPHSHYSYYFNTIEISPTSLTGLFYDDDLDDVVNYPRLGYIIARQMLHAFDPVGRHFSSDGQYEEETASEYLVRDGKMNTAYTQQSGPVNKYVENFADFSAPLLAFTAYHQSNPTIETIFGLNLEQGCESFGCSFFLLLANLMCETTSDAHLTYLKEQGTYAPSRARVNVPLSHNEQFAHYFRCADSTFGNQGVNSPAPYWNPPESGPPFVRT